MAESYSKKEFNKKKLEKQREKEKRREERKINNDKGKHFDDMIMYVDENGQLTEVPPTENRNSEIELSEIQLGAAPIEAESKQKSGIITFLNEEKEYGFITSSKGGENLFFHLSNCAHQVKKGNKVIFEVVKSPKGFAAIDIQIAK